MKKADQGQGVCASCSLLLALSNSDEYRDQRSIYYNCDRLEQSTFISKENRDLVTKIIKRQGEQYFTC